MKKSNIKNIIKEAILETENKDTITITISKISPNNKSKFIVTYEIATDNNLLEIEGILKSYNTGRSKEFEFEPSFYSDEEAEKYYDENWENIEDQILKSFNEKF